MRIFFYPPFKPLGHPNPSGDLVTATGLYDYLKGRGHQIAEANTLRARWIYWKPWNWPKILREQNRSFRDVTRLKPDLWLTYHAYYKAPDLLGPTVCHRSRVPYCHLSRHVFFQEKKEIEDSPRIHLEQKGPVCRPQKVFTNRKEDLVNLRRIIPHHRISYVAPGYQTGGFCVR